MTQDITDFLFRKKHDRFKLKTNQTIFCLLLLAWVSACESAPKVQIDMQSTPKIFNKALPEISGFAASILKPGHLWTINDSGNSSKIFRLGKNLKIKQSIKLKVRNRDWEDLAAFYDGENSWIIVADTGDNERKYQKYFLHFYLESRLLRAGNKSLKPDKTIIFSYSNGSQNCEAVAIDPIRKEVILINKKNKKPPTAYRLSLDSYSKSTATKISKLKHFAKRSQITRLAKNLTGVNLDAVTAMDISADGKIAIVLTYKDILLYQRSDNSDWANAFSGTPQFVARHTLTQAESISIDPLKPIVTLTSEKLPAPVLKLNIEHFISHLK